MTHEIRTPLYADMDGALVGTVRAILATGRSVAPRGQETLEALSLDFRLDEPRARRIILPARRWNEALAVGELCWHLSGSRDVDFIAYYAKPWASFSDDGQHVTGSCYGHKIFGRVVDPNGRVTPSQWERLLAHLTADRYSRRAVLALGAEFESPESLDVACLREVQFLVRDNRLHCIASMRSNDVIWGLSYDVYLVTMLQERLALELGVGLGWYHHRAASMHLYRRHYVLAEEIAAVDPAAAPPMPPMDRVEDIPHFLETERRLRLGEDWAPPHARLSGYWRALAAPLVKLATARRARPSPDPGALGRAS